MPNIAIPQLAHIRGITDHAVSRYRERRQRLPCFIIDDLLSARPLTKAQMRKKGFHRRRRGCFLRTADRFLFIINNNSVVTCYYENSKVSNEPSYSTTSPVRKRTGRSGSNARARRAIRNSSRTLEQRDEFSLQVQSAGISPESL